MLGATRCAAGEWRPATPRLPHEPSDDRPCLHVHRCGAGVIAPAHAAPWVRVGLEHRQKVDGVDLESRGYGRQGSLPPGRRRATARWRHASCGYGLFEAKRP
jgi:hypothetical protein